MLREELAASMATRLGARLARPAFRRFAQRVDPSGFGGAPLLGVNGLCLVGHGRSSARAVRNGIALANRFAAESLVPRLADAVARLTPCPSRGPVPS
jgi:glycerol-3-phosphate acyltransferase PlsX